MGTAAGPGAGQALLSECLECRGPWPGLRFPGRDWAGRQARQRPPGPHPCLFLTAPQIHPRILSALRGCGPFWPIKTCKFPPSSMAIQSLYPGLWGKT